MACPVSATALVVIVCTFGFVWRPGADDFLPVFIYILTLSKLHRPATCLTYIQYVAAGGGVCGE